MQKFKNIIWYFFIFSIVGMFLEMTFCYTTTGVIESRQGLIWGPFCPIYGVGAVVLIIALGKNKDSPIKLFLIGTILGAVTEYIVSYGLEAIYGSRFWDYAYKTYHLNGRICVTYSVLWGILSIFLIRHAKKWIDNLLSKIKPKANKILQIIIVIFFIIDTIATLVATILYTNRVYRMYNGDEQEMTTYRKIEETIFSNEKMIRTFPNIRIKSNDGEEIFARDVITKLKPKNT